MNLPHNPQSGVTLRDIAHALGISHVAVSLALRGHPKIPPTRRDEVQRVAKRMGYSPNLTALALSHYKRNVKKAPSHAALAWLNLSPEEDTWRRDEESHKYWQAAYAEAERIGYQLESYTPRKSSPPKDLVTELTERDFVGLTIPPQAQIPSDWNDFPWPDFPAVQVGCSHNDLHVPFVTSDDLNNTIETFIQVEKKGYRRIGLILDQRSDRSEILKAGFLHAHSIRHGAGLLPPLVLSGRREDDLKSSTTEWFRSHGPDVIIVEHQEQLGQLGTMIDLPAETGIVHLNIPDESESTFAGIRRNSCEIARVAMQTLAAQIQDHLIGFPTVLYRQVVEGTWLDGASLPSRR